MLKPGVMAPVLVLCLAQVMTVANVNHIYSFLAAYLLHIGVEPTQVSKQAGIGEALEAVSEIATLSIHVWAMRRYSHRWLTALSLITIGSISTLFGFSTQVWQIYLLRILTGAGVIGGLLTIVMIGEITDQESRTQAFAYLAAGLALGSTGGHALSGYLAEPFGRVPLFGSISFLKLHPYVLPGFVILGLSSISALAVLIFVPETNTRTIDRHDRVDAPRHKETTLTYRALFGSPLFRQFILVNLGNKTCNFGANAMMTTAGGLPLSIGGLGMEVPQLGQTFFLTSILNASWSGVVYQRIVSRVSIRNIVRLAPLGWILSALFFPIANYLITHGSRGTSLVFGLWYIGEVVGRMWRPTQNVIAVILYPDAQDRALAAGTVKQSSNLATIIGTAGYGYIFGYSNNQPTGSWGRQTVWICTIGVSLCTVLIASRQPEMLEPDPCVNVDPRASGEDERASLVDSARVEDEQNTRSVAGV